MFDFEKLEVYEHVRNLNKKIYNNILSKGLKDDDLHDLLKKASLGALFNLSQGTGRMTKSEKKRFYTNARTSIYEVVSIIQVLIDLGHLNNDIYDDIYVDCERCSKMLLGMIRSMTDKRD